METNAENHIEVREARSYARCIGLGLGMAADHVGVVLGHTWPSVVLSLLLPFPGIFFFAGQVDRLLGEWRELGYVPRRRGMEGWREDLRCTLRALARLLLFTLLVLVMVAASWAAWRFLPHGKWICPAVFVILTLALLPSGMAMMEMACSGKPLLRCLSGWATGYRHYGSLFPFQLLLFMLTLLIVVPGMLPSAVTGIVTAKAWLTIQGGDTLMIPALWPLVLTVASIIGTAFVLVAITVRAFCHMLFWGSIKAREAGEQG